MTPVAAPHPAVHRRYISQGEHAIDGGQDVVIETLLGSCVSACIWDPTRGIGGMNHVLFVDENANASTAFGHGVNGMELLINGLLRLGADRTRLRAKIFGGARMVDGLTDAGRRNGEFVQAFLSREQIENCGGDLGGMSARRVEFWPGSGRARVKCINANVQDAPVASHRDTRDVELF